MNAVEQKVLNKHLVAVRQQGCSWHIKPNHSAPCFFEAVKAECIWDAKVSSANYLPRFPIHVDESVFPDLYRWRMAFHSDNSPAAVSFKGREAELAEALRDVDFSKRFDSTVAEAIRSRFSARPGRRAEVDADLMIQGELGELPE